MNGRPPIFLRKKKKTELSFRSPAITEIFIYNIATIIYDSLINEHLICIRLK